jgi:hypothetical protein
MTKPDEVVVSDAEIDRFQKRLIRQDGFHYRAALQEFLAKRVPDAAPRDRNFHRDFNRPATGAEIFNACRERVLKGDE